jgi:pimeloyl-ACP methyl ester carboxylesterase
MPKIVVNGITLHYWQLGKGPDVVMLHGLGGNLAVWHLKMVPELQRMNRITTYDLRGHGYSEAPQDGYTTQDLAEDLRHLLDALGIERTHLVGHSWGGDIALHFALLYPHRVAKMVVIEAGLVATLAPWYRRDDWEGWAYWADMLEQATGVKFSFEQRHNIEYLIRQIVKVPIVYGPAKGQSRNEELVLRTLRVLSPMWNGCQAEHNLTVEQLHKIPHPTLLLYDADSPYLKSYEILCDRLADCTPVLLPSTGIKHFSLLEQPELLLERIRDFL